MPPKLLHFMQVLAVVQANEEISSLKSFPDEGGTSTYGLACFLLKAAVADGPAGA